MRRPTTDDLERANELAAQLRLRATGLALPETVIHAASLAAVLVAVFSPVAGTLTVVAVAAVMLLVGAGARRFQRPRLDNGLRVARILLSAALAVAAPAAAAPAALLALVALGELPLARAEIVARPAMANVAGVRHRRSLPGGGVLAITTACIGVAGALLLLDARAGWIWIPAGVAALVTALKAFGDLVRIRDRHRQDARVGGILAELAPRFAVYWDGEPGTAYQLAMWTPNLDALRRPYVVIVRDPDMLDEAAAATRSPVFVRIRHSDLDEMVVPGMTSAFYVNNALSNANFVRFPGIWHLQLNHGDSGKAPSFNPSMRMYDRDFVAGPAAIERFAEHGIDTRPGFFEIVGRPQTAAVSTTPRRPDGAVERVLYAPTWAGFNADTAHSSLIAGPDIVRELIRREQTVWFRPHPNTRLNDELERSAGEVRRILREDRDANGRQHVFDDPPAHTLFEMFDASDALITDVSSVLSDYLATGKPYAISSMLQPAELFSELSPVAQGGYVFTPDARSITAAVDALLGPDPARAAREGLRAEVLGTAVAPDPAAAFAEAALRYVDAAKGAAGTR
ncbi:CDP-glycerol glycerophosphotransferase family protein [Agromyces archimandritae]|uniref:CDP-glycerol glycerophosphotransferase family protein n=1 Tax=Agromyces archimandritae TaxID=2781962 RepID=A0A975IP41_9MICO|nr:CDP-glycerol glycerophosphotransferase family protein [Agromyces archimandritae]QTX05258.1 CDP-glycerol glycerophosphotransferase family protein [Agromyces archimandritae]